MIIGNIHKGDKTVSFELDISCTNCQKKVPGGVKTTEKYFGTYSFLLEIDELKKNYLCGVCRDKKRSKI